MSKALNHEVILRLAKQAKAKFEAMNDIESANSCQKIIDDGELQPHIDNIKRNRLARYESTPKAYTPKTDYQAW